MQDAGHDAAGALTGVVWDGSAVTNAETYAFANLELAGAAPLDREPDGRIVSTVASYGRGRVIVTSPLRMTPKRAGTIPTGDVAVFELAVK